MAKIQLAYKYTGENHEEICNLLTKLKKILELNGHEVYVPILNLNRPKNKRELFIDTLEKIKNQDVLISIVKSSEKSERMLMEIGHAIGLKKKVIALLQKNINNTHLRELADKVIEFDTIKDLDEILKKEDILNCLD